MQARGALMREHRLIERMLSAIEAALAETASTRHVDPEFVDVAVDFIRDVRRPDSPRQGEDTLFSEWPPGEMAGAGRSDCVDDLERG